MTDQPNTNPDAFRTAIVASERLRTALGQHQLTLPSLRGGYPTLTGEPFVELGGCHANVIEQLAAILERTAPDPGGEAR
ncbi:hypothetical protein ACIBCA_36840 [Kitasatospora sp. NPDC051170]|uniref:hypothetical protein n=1 Tax=Kitasatospora sp. NPDC051170 TaxID=3364056 RepID=UPI00379EE5D9